MINIVNQKRTFAFPCILFQNKQEAWLLSSFEMDTKPKGHMY